MKRNAGEYDAERPQRRAPEHCKMTLLCQEVSDLAVQLAAKTSPKLSPPG